MVRDQEGSAHPVHVYDGDDALITCVVRDLGNNSVVWKREDQESRRWKVLTAGQGRVTLDPRIQVLHDEGIRIGGVIPKNHNLLPFVRIGTQGNECFSRIQKKALPTPHIMYWIKSFFISELHRGSITE